MNSKKKINKSALFACIFFLYGIINLRLRGSTVRRRACDANPRKELLWTLMKNLKAAHEPAAEMEFCGREGDTKFAGVHILAELWQAKHLNDVARIRNIIKKAIDACGATMLSIDLHEFSPNGGVSGVAILKESHISIHTWPEFEYAAIDIFVCGTVNPRLAIPVFEAEFQPGKMELNIIKRGILP